MGNRIRYAWGRCPFGDFIVAMSGKDVVMFGFPLRGSDPVDELRRRFPDAAVEEDAPGLKSTIDVCARFLDHPDRHPSPRSAR